MKMLLVMAAMVMCLFVLGCAEEQDISELEDQIDDLEDQVDELEEELDEDPKELVPATCEELLQGIEECNIRFMGSDAFLMCEGGMEDTIECLQYCTLEDRTCEVLNFCTSACE